MLVTCAGVFLHSIGLPVLPTGAIVAVCTKHSSGHLCSLSVVVIGVSSGLGQGLLIIGADAVAAYASSSLLMSLPDWSSNCHVLQLRRCRHCISSSSDKGFLIIGAAIISGSRCIIILANVLVRMVLSAISAFSVLSLSMFRPV